MSEYMMELRGISKSFPGVKALDQVDFDLKAGEVHALLGENGAGKSTLMKIIGGIHQRDEGDYRIDGIKMDHLTPKSAQKHGIAIIHQELNVCEDLSVAENIFLGREACHFGLLHQKKMNEAAQEILDELKIDIDPKTLVKKLPVSKQQMVEIAKALSANARILIMDEPTSALTDREITELFEMVHKLKASGCGIVYISHRLEELERITDRVSIFRDGRYISTQNFKDTDLDKIISLMVGRTIKNKFPNIACDKGESILEVMNLSSGIVKNVSFNLYEGEILGIAGLMGAGRTELVRAIFGAEPVESGEVVLKGRQLSIKSPHDAIEAGIVLGPEDRKLEGLCTKLSIRENVALANLDKICNKYGIIDREKEMQLTEEAINSLKVKTPTAEQVTKNLSGGNQQKIVVGKWLVRNAEVVIFDEPTRGIDVAAKVEIYNIMNALKAKGIGVLFISSEMPEVMCMSDRILVMCNGKITGELMSEEATQDQILQYATMYKA